MLTIFLLVVDGCAVAKYLIPQRFRQLLSVLNLTMPFLFVFSFGLTLVLYYHLILQGLHTKRKKSSRINQGLYENLGNCKHKKQVYFKQKARVNANMRLV